MKDISFVKKKEPEELYHARIVSIDRNKGKVTLFMKNGLFSIGHYLHDLDDLRENMTVLVGKVNDSHVILSKISANPKISSGMSLVEPGGYTTLFSFDFDTSDVTYNPEGFLGKDYWGGPLEPPYWKDFYRDTDIVYSGASSIKALPDNRPDLICMYYNPGTIDIYATRTYPEYVDFKITGYFRFTNLTYLDDITFIYLSTYSDYRDAFGVFITPTIVYSPDYTKTEPILIKLNGTDREGTRFNVEDAAYVQSLSPDTWHQFNITLNGRNLFVKIDDILILEHLFLIDNPLPQIFDYVGIWDYLHNATTWKDSIKCDIR